MRYAHRSQCNAFFFKLNKYGTFLAQGNAILKVPLDVARVLSMMWGCPIPPFVTNRWAQQTHTPPYISSTPSVKHFSFEKGDIFAFCSDGLRSSLKEQGVPDQDDGNTIISLAASGVDLLDDDAVLSYEKTIGHSFIPSADINNIADRVIRNILFGLNDHCMAKETMTTMNWGPDHLRDDMSVSSLRFCSILEFLLFECILVALVVRITNLAHMHQENGTGRLSSVEFDIPFCSVISKKTKIQRTGAVGKRWLIQGGTGNLARDPRSRGGIQTLKHEIK